MAVPYDKSYLKYKTHLLEWTLLNSNRLLTKKAMCVIAHRLIASFKLTYLYIDSYSKLQPQENNPDDSKKWE